MKLTSLWNQTPVFCRVFGPLDESHTFGLKQDIIGWRGAFDYAEADVFAGEPDVQLELKRDGLSGAPILNATKNRLFLRHHHYVLRANGTVDEFRVPVLRVTTPTSNATLPRSRLGDVDLLEAQLDLQDWFALGLNYDVEQLQVLFSYRYPGQSEEPILNPVAIIQQVPATQIVIFKVDFRFPRPGAVAITCRITGPAGKQRSATSWVQAEVAATGSRTISARFANPILGTNPPTFPAIASAVQGTLTTNTQDYFATLQYRYAPAGWGNPTMPWVTATAPAGGATREWPFSLSIPANAAPRNYSLIVRDVDAFGDENLRFYAFDLRDTVPPELVIAEPADGQVYVTDDPASLVIPASGTVRDAQTAVDTASVAWTIGGAPQAPLLNGASWSAQLRPGAYGSFDLRITARDSSSPNPNTANAVRRFEVVSSFRPATLEELLGPQSYLRELLRFARSHLAKNNAVPAAPVTPQDVELLFLQPFEKLARPRAPESKEVTSDVLVPIRLLRARERLDQNQAADLETAVSLVAEAALVGRWDFSELLNGATDGLIERYRGFGSFGLSGTYEISAGVQAIGQTATALTGSPGTPQEGAFRSTGSSRIVIGASGDPQSWAARALALGRVNRDFSLSFWIRPEDSGAGAWRAVVFRGTEASGPANLLRTPGIWLLPSENRIHFRISTSADRNEGGNSAAVLQTGAWSHVAYVKSGRCLRLYLNGLLDQEVVLRSADMLPSYDPLYLGANPHYAGFVGALSEFRIYATALGEDEIRYLAQDRRAGMPNVGNLGGGDTGTAQHRYCNAAYAALLRGLGTSAEEIAMLGNLSDEQRKALETRLGMAGLAGQPGQVLDVLVPGNTGNATQFEKFLAGNFGLPLTYWPTAAPQLPGGTPLVLQHRQAGLEHAYAAEDADPARWPDLDPDLVAWEELHPAAEAWRQLYMARNSELATMFRQLSDPRLSVSDMLKKVYSAVELRQLMQLGQDDAAGTPIVDGMAALSLDLTMLRQILAYLDATSLLEPQRADLAHLLVEAWKRRNLRALWLSQEAALPTRPWPTVAGPGAWVPDLFRRDFLPWRGSVRRRTAMEDRLGARHRAFDALVQEHARLLLDVQRSTLPRLRDELLGIGDLPALACQLGALQQLLLTDVTAAGAVDLSVVEQATSSLQVLINGIRRGWFGDGHPAQSWRPLDAAAFDAQWNGIDSYGRWRTSMLNYLYAENTLYSELRQANSQKFLNCLKQLRAIQPLTVAALEDATQPYVQAVVALRPRRRIRSVEYDFFVPVAEGLALQRAGQMEAALRRYAKVLDVALPPGQRRKVNPVAGEPVAQPALAVFSALDWAAALENPHKRASLPVGQRIGCQNPYTRFVLFQILYCTLTLADAAFARATVDDRTLARSLYLEAQDILAMDELVDVPPLVGGQAYLANPLLAAYRARAASGLRKLRLGLSVLGTPIPPDPTRGPGAAGLSSLVRPTPYPYRVLVERAKQLAGMAQQFEAQYLSAIDRNEAELEKLMQQGFALELTAQTVELRRLGTAEAETGQGLAVLQEGRSRIEQDRLNEWLAIGDNFYEREQISAMAAASDWRQVANVAQTVAAVASSGGAAAASAVKSFGVASGFYAGAAVAQAVAGVAQGFVIDREAQAQFNSLYAARERRDDEWHLRRDLAAQDGLIGAQGVRLADDRLAIARQELVMAEAQATHAAQMLAFLRNKFTSAEFYDWLAGVLAETYGFFLQMAAALAHQAELQLAFQRQESPQRLIRTDYWKLASSDGSKDRRGISGSARLLQDLYALDQYAFNSERRLLNLTQSFSAARLMPVELEAFRRTGVLVFNTPMSWFDDGFPGHYLRLVKRVRVSISALIQPSVGVRATLSNTGMSRVVTADPGYPTMVIRQDPQSVALTSPSAATGVFELDTQSELLYPFEGTGVDTSWTLELPPAGNPFDFDTLMDVMVSIDYTALHSVDLRERVAKTLPRRVVSARVFSVKRDLPDVWYELANCNATDIALRLSAAQFPPGLSGLRVQDIALAARTVDGKDCAYQVQLQIGAAAAIGPVTAMGGTASSRQSGAQVWRTALVTLPEMGQAPQPWTWRISNAPEGGVADPDPILQQLKDGTVDDILIAITFSGLRPAW